MSDEPVQIEDLSRYVVELIAALHGLAGRNFAAVTLSCCTPWPRLAHKPLTTSEQNSSAH